MKVLSAKSCLGTVIASFLVFYSPHIQTMQQAQQASAADIKMLWIGVGVVGIASIAAIGLSLYSLHRNASIEKNQARIHRNQKRLYNWYRALNNQVFFNKIRTCRILKSHEAIIGDLYYRHRNCGDNRFYIEI